MNRLPEEEQADSVLINKMSIEIGSLFGPSPLLFKQGEQWYDNSIRVQKKRGNSVIFQEITR